MTGYRFNIHFCILNVHFFRFKVHFFFYTIHFFLFKVHFIFIHKSTYVKISIIKLIVLVQAQVFEKQFKIFCCSVNTFLQVRIVCTNKCISEIPRIFLTIFVKFIYLTFRWGFFPNFPQINLFFICLCFSTLNVTAF